MPKTPPAGNGRSTATTSGRASRKKEPLLAASGTIDVSLLGQTMHIAATCDRLELDGATLLGRQTGFDLGARPRHDVQFACR